jgi:hypothetical protein
VGADDPVVPIEPRFTFLAGVRIRLGPHEAPEPVVPVLVATEPEPAQAPEPLPVAVEPSPVSLRGTLADEGGNALPDVAVTVVDSRGETQTTRTAADGTFLLEVLPGSVELRFETPGFEHVVRREELTEDSELGEILMRPALPAGELRGLIRSFSGAPLAAQVQVEPSGTRIDTATSGEFALELAPGAYTVTIRAEGYDVQRRPVVVRDNGVTILNVELRKAQ